MSIGDYFKVDELTCLDDILSRFHQEPEYGKIYGLDISCVDFGDDGWAIYLCPKRGPTDITVTGDNSFCRFGNHQECIDAAVRIITILLEAKLLFQVESESAHHIEIKRR